ncbi:MAG: hypothetical protein P4L64_18625 [Caulobacteraceae bacterium]|nr:hypothetical protein [Caulobacteraceae bacterium]
MTIITPAQASPERKVSVLLGVGIFLLPIAFVWFLLRNGYSLVARIIGFGWLLVFLFFGFGPHPNPGPAAQHSVSTPSSSSAANATSANDAASSSSAPSAPAGKWLYREDTDEMRGFTSHYTTLPSNEVLQFKFPYAGGTSVILTLRQKQKGTDVMLVVTNGQFLCNDFSNRFILAKFDNGPIQKYRCEKTDDGSANTIFILGERKFLAELKKSKTVTIETEFFREGAYQLTFDSAGLKWDY